MEATKSGVKKRSAAGGAKERVKEEAAEANPPGNMPEGRKRQRGPKPEQCKDFTKEELAAAWPEIVKALLKLAKEGSITHTKFMIEFTGLKELAKELGGSVKDKSLSKILRDELERQRLTERTDAKQALAGGQAVDIASVRRSKSENPCAVDPPALS